MAVGYSKTADYDKLIEEALAQGDYTSAATYEQSRNAQIEGERRDYWGEYGTPGYSFAPSYQGGREKSTTWAQYLDDDYVPKGTDDYDSQYMGQADYDTLQRYREAYNEAASMDDRASMQMYHDMAEELRAKYGYSGGSDGSEYIKFIGSGGNYGTAGGTNQGAPTYTDKYASSIDAMLNEILNREDFSYEEAPTYTDKYTDQIGALLNEIQNRGEFSYDAATDPTYQKYAQQYTQAGQRSMKDTLGQAAAQTGGIASSYAVGAAQQANDYYMSQLAAKMPELRQLAYSMYMDDYNKDIQNLGLLQSMSNTDYGRYRDSLADWSNNRAMAYAQYLDSIDNQVRDLGLLQSMSDTQYDRYRDTMNDWRNDRDFAYGMHRDEVSDQQWQQSVDQNNADNSFSQNMALAELLAQYGDFSGFANLGLTDSQIGNMSSSYQNAQQVAAQEQEEAKELTLSQAKAILKENPRNEEALAAYEKHTGKNYLSGNDEFLSYDPKNPAGSSIGYRNVLARIKMGTSADEVIALIERGVETGSLTEEEAIELMDYAGY